MSINPAEFYKWLQVFGVPSGEGGQSGFADNALFVGTAGQSISSSSPTALNISSLNSASTNNTWALNGDNKGMKCGKVGYYEFVATIVASVSGTAGGACYFRFAKNGAVFGPMMTVNILTSLDVRVVPVVAEQSFAANDVLTINGYSGASGYSVVDPATSGALHSCAVKITRLN